MSLGSRFAHSTLTLHVGLITVQSGTCDYTKMTVPCVFTPNVRIFTLPASLLPSAMVLLMADRVSDDVPPDSNIITFSEQNSV